MVEIDDTYAEAFESYYIEVLLTAKNERWLSYAVEAVTGNASSSISCDCEAGLNITTDNAPDKRAGALVQFHVPVFTGDAVRKLELAVIHRLGNSVLTCPTASAFNATTGDPLEIGKKIGFFGDGYQKVVEKFGRNMMSIPIMMGDFLVEEKMSYASGVMGGNLWLMADSEDSALDAGEKIIDIISHMDGVITPFPGGVCASGSKVGSKYKFMIASTHHTLCPTLKDLEDHGVPEGVTSILEVVIDGRDIDIVSSAMTKCIATASSIDGLIRISAGNYGGKLGKYRINLK